MPALLYCCHAISFTLWCQLIAFDWYLMICLLYIIYFIAMLSSLFIAAIASSPFSDYITLLHAFADIIIDYFQYFFHAYAIHWWHYLFAYYYILFIDIWCVIWNIIFHYWYWLLMIIFMPFHCFSPLPCHFIYHVYLFSLADIDADYAFIFFAIFSFAFFAYYCFSIIYAMPLIFAVDYASALRSIWCRILSLSIFSLMIDTLFFKGAADYFMSRHLCFSYWFSE